jgi:cytochrome P450
MIAKGSMDTVRHIHQVSLHDLTFQVSLIKTMTLMSQFILSMMKNPQVLAKAQEEIDRVIGNDRLPTIQDRPDLPYIECVMSESIRWGPALPLSGFMLTSAIAEDHADHWHI